MRKLISAILMLCLLVTVPINAKEHDEKDKKKNIKLQEISMEEIPEGLIPIRFDSLEEAEAFFSEIPEGYIDLEIDEQSDFQNDGVLSTKAISTRTITKSKQYGLGKINLKGEIEIYSSGSFYQISELNRVWTTFTGFTYGFTWNPASGGTGGKISSDKQSVRIYTSGTIGWYVIIDVSAYLYQDEVDMEYTYKL